MDISRVETTLILARSGDSTAFETMFSPVRPYARRLAKRFFANGWDTEDLYQEALAGFAGALFSFESDKGVDFHDYARLSMRNNVVACVRRATRLKRGGTESTASLDCLEWSASDEFRPDLLVEQEDKVQELLLSLKTVLSAAEWQVLQHVMAGESLSEVAEQVGVNLRAVENALSRARVKARRVIAAA